jgi:ATP-binding cassette subfamily F protein 3
VCDDLLLVDGGRVQDFRQEIDAYPRWLAERRNLGPVAASGLDAPKQAPSIDKKERKRREAEFRKTIGPQLNRQTRLERAIEKLQQQLAEAEARMSDSSLYEDAKKNELQALIFTQADIKKQIEELETEWFEISEDIEQLRATFLASEAE